MKSIPYHHLIDKLALANGLISGIALFPQVVALLVSRHTQGLSLTSFAIIFLNSGVWLTYAVHRCLVPLIVASFFNIVASGILVGAILFLG